MKASTGEIISIDIVERKEKVLKVLHDRNGNNHRNQISLRDYQSACITAVEQSSSLRQLIALPTGSGKTILFAEIAKRRNGKTLVLAHRDELITQAVDKIMMVDPFAEIGVVKASRNEFDKKITVASVPTLSRKDRLENLLAFDYDLVITDEAHHASAVTYQAIYKHAIGEKTLHIGVTATPFRSDKRHLSDTFDTPPVFEQNILNMIGRGHLSPVNIKHVNSQVTIGSDEHQINLTENKRRDFQRRTTRQPSNMPTLGKILNTREYVKLAVDSWKEITKGERKSTICFAVDVAHAYAIAEEFNAQGIKAIAIHGDLGSDDRAKKIKDFKEGVYQVIVNCNILTEGFDHPEVDCILLCKPTKSEGQLTQMCGRGTRKAEGKVDCLIIDIACKSEKERIARPSDLFLPDEVYFAKQIARLIEICRDEVRENHSEMINRDTDISDVAVAELDGTDEIVHELPDGFGEIVRTLNKNKQSDLGSKVFHRITLKKLHEKLAEISDEKHLAFSDKDEPGKFYENFGNRFEKIKREITIELEIEEDDHLYPGNAKVILPLSPSGQRQQEEGLDLTIEKYDIVEIAIAGAEGLSFDGFSDGNGGFTLDIWHQGQIQVKAVKKKRHQLQQLYDVLLVNAKSRRPKQLLAVAVPLSEAEKKVGEIVANHGLTRALNNSAGWRSDSASEKQLRYLKSLGIETLTDHEMAELTKGQASAMIAKAKKQGAYRSA